MSEPKFKVGDLAVNKAGLALWKVEAESAMHIGGIKIGLPETYTIISVQTEECHGGVHFHYGVRTWNDHRSILVNEVELEHYDAEELVAGLDKAWPKASK